ncbi:MAG: iron-siderophore ABC transporter substrate-binding protein [Dehalococcoidia bacterium]
MPIHPADLSPPLRPRRHRVAPALVLFILTSLSIVAVACTSSESSDQAGQTFANATAAAVASGTPAAEAPCRTVQHELGSACIPAEPRRIVTLDPLTALPTLVDLGAPVVASASVYPTGTLFQSYLDPAVVQRLAVVGSSTQPDIEKIVLAKPDLIVGWDRTIQPIQSKLEAIAPVVATKYSFYNHGWRDDVLFIADLVGKRDQAARQLAELDRRSEALRPRLAIDGRPLQLSRVDSYQGQALYYDFDCTWFGEVLTRAGVQQPPAQQSDCTNGDPRTTIVYVSNEQFSVLDGDAIVTDMQPQSAADAAANPLTVLGQNPLWSGLKAVRNSRTFAFGDAWGLGASIRAANVMLDDLEAKLAR